MKHLNPEQFIREYGIKSVACFFSGGKDSLAATHFIMSTLKDYNIQKRVVHVDTGCMLPITTPFIQGVCETFGWPLTILYGNFFQKAEKFGMPRMRHRWCCFHCKLKPIIEYMKDLPFQRAEITGLRRDESARRAHLPQIIRKKGSSSWGYAPILFWTKKM